MGGYCEAPWDQRLSEIEPSGNYVITHERNDPNIGSDYGFAEA
jgi:beta-galactosidase